MLSSFRTAFKSKIGVGIVLAFLVLIALAFTSGDIANTGSFGGIAGGDRVAMVGDERIDTSTLVSAANTALDRARQEDPTVSMRNFLATNGLEQVLDNLIDRLAIAVFGKENGIVASDRLIDSEIAQLPAFRGADGEFSEDVYRQAMQQQGLNEAAVRNDISQGLIARQVMLPAGFGAKMSRQMTRRYAALLQETRKGSILVVPSLAFVEKTEPTDAEISQYYSRNQNRFIRPERRVIRYATFGTEALGKGAEPTDAEIAFRYENDKARFAASESRRVTQVVVPTEAAAKALAAEVSGGTSLAAAAQAKGLAASSTEMIDKQTLAQQTSAAVANAVFAANEGRIATPARGPLGWHVVRVEEVARQSARTLAQAREELASEIRTEKQRVAIAETLERIEDRFDSGASLGEAAQSLGLEVQSTRPVLASGVIYQTADETIPDVVRPVLDSAFAMDSEEPQLAEAVRGETFIIYDVTDIAESAPAPLAEIKADVRSAFIMDKASRAARAAAVSLQKAVKGGKSVANAVRDLGKQLPPAQQVSMGRPELTRMQQQGQQVPPPVALMFNMAEGTSKVQKAPGDRGWFVVTLDDIEPGKVAADDPMIDPAAAELGSVLGDEYSQALGRAIRSLVGVERNPDGIRAVRERLGGGATGGSE